MTKTAEEVRRRAEGQTAALFDPTGAINGIEPLLQASNKWFENWMSVGSEILEFSKARLDRSVEISKAIAQTSSVDQAMDLQADYARTMVRDYFDQAGKLADMGTRALMDSLTAWQPVVRGNGAARGDH